MKKYELGDMIQSSMDIYCIVESQGRYWSIQSVSTNKKYLIMKSETHKHYALYKKG